MMGTWASLVLLQAPARALVNPIDQSLIEQSTDLGSGALLTRTFHSANKKIGLFGQGWCSVLETTLIVKADSAEFNFCGAGKITTFQKIGQSWTSSDPSYRLERGIRESRVTEGFRISYVFDQGGTLKAMTAGSERVRLGRDANNRIFSIRTPSAGYTFRYADDRLADVTSTRGATIRYAFQKDRLKTVKLPGGHESAYGYDESGHLTEVVQAGKRTNYQYAGDKVSTIIYGDCSDRLGEMADGINVETRCRNEPTRRTSFIFQGGSRAGKLSVEKRLGFYSYKRTWENSRLAEERTNQGTTTYAYDPNGLIRKITSPTQTIEVNERVSGQASNVTVVRAGRAQSVRAVWSSGSIRSLANDRGDLNMDISRTPSSTRVTGDGFDLTMRETPKGNWISGRLGGSNFAPFELRDSTHGYDKLQLRAAGSLTQSVQLATAIEGL